MAASTRPRTTTRKEKAADATPATATAVPFVSKTAGLPLPQRVEALRDTLFDSIEQEVATGNVRVILWLADRLRVLEAANATETKPADELRAFFEQLDGNALREFAGLAARDA